MSNSNVQTRSVSSMKGEGNGKDVATNEDIMKYLKQMNETLTGINTKLEVLEGKHDKLEERVTAHDAKVDSLQGNTTTSLLWNNSVFVMWRK